MNRFTRVLRALILALVLPALLVPSGWSARVCLCELLLASDSQACCEPSTSAEAVEAIASCCAEESAAATRPQAATLDACAESQCDDCCRVVEAGQIELAVANDAPVTAPAPTLSSVAIGEVVVAPASRRGAVHEARRALAPPRASSALPLRI